MAFSRFVSCPNDKIAVCISGGKDSFLLAKCIQELQRHGRFPFDAEFVVMNPGYNEKNRQLIIYESAEKIYMPHPTHQEEQNCFLHHELQIWVQS